MAKKLVVIDGKSVFYRGYYAMPNLSTSIGTPTSGVYGFAMMALRVLDLLKPDYVIVAWDKSKTNIRARRKLYPLYKANRKPMPQDLRDQIPLLRQLLTAFNWPLLEVDDFEADDIMATLAVQAKQKGLITTLVSSDLDILQAVHDGIDMLALKKGLTNVVEYTRTKFTEEYGMTPEQFIDYKALKGDASDNVPGVAGVGDKTARDLVQRFGTLEGVYNHLDKIADKLRAKLEAGRDMAFLSHKLLEIRFDAPVKLDLKAADAHDVDPRAINNLLHKLEFKNLIRLLPPVMKFEETAPSLPKVKGKLKDVVLDVVALVHLDSAIIELMELKSHPETVIHTLKSHTTSFEIAEVTGWLISVSPKHCLLIDNSKTLPVNELKRRLLPLFASIQGLVGHDLKNDLRILLELGLELPKVGFDAMVGAFVLNPLLRSRSLEDLAKSELDIDLTTPDLELTDVKKWGPRLTSTIWQLKEHYQAGLNNLPKLQKLLTDIEWPIIPVLARMEQAGIKLDTAYLAKMSKDLADQIIQIQTDIWDEAKEEFNISSPQQLAKVLFENLQLPTTAVKKTQTGYSTAATELDKLRGLHPIINHITQYREFSKLKSTYVDALPKLVDSHSRLHTSFNLTTAQTGRLSSENPNLQNIPIRTEVGRQIRQAFIAGPGNALISADYSQFELRLAAVLAGDDNMIHAFNKGIDIHAMTAAELYDVDIDMVTSDMRRNAKTVNFGVLYGLSPHGLSVATGMTRDKAKDFIDRYFSLRQKLLKYMEGLKAKAHKDGYVETLFGRRRPTPDVHSSNFIVRSAAERAAMNMPIQGTAADLMKLAMIKIDEQLPKISSKARMLLQIHDSILAEAPKVHAERVAELLGSSMENVHKLPVKLEVDTKIGQTWGDL